MLICKKKKEIGIQWYKYHLTLKCTSNFWFCNLISQRYSKHCVAWGEAEIRKLCSNKPQLRVDSCLNKALDWFVQPHFNFINVRQCVTVANYFQQKCFLLKFISTVSNILSCLVTTTKY